MVSNDPIKDYMRRHACGFPEALEALAAQLGPPTAHDIRHALQTLGRTGASVDLLEALEAWRGSRQELCVAVRHRRTNRQLDVGIP
jgi:hypothetical protein